MGFAFFAARLVNLMCVSTALPQAKRVLLYPCFAYPYSCEGYIPLLRSACIPPFAQQEAGRGMNRDKPVTPEYFRRF
jgi:hypothetical protein